MNRPQGGFDAADCKPIRERQIPNGGRILTPETADGMAELERLRRAGTLDPGLMHQGTIWPDAEARNDNWLHGAASDPGSGPTLTTNRMQEIMVDADLNHPRRDYTVEENRFRDKIEAELAEAHRRGESVEFTTELADDDGSKAT